MLKLDHVTINVTDMKATEDFYETVFGLEKLPSVDMGDHEIHYYDLGDGLLLELIKYCDPQEELHPEVKTRGIYRHIALRVDDVDEVYEKARAYAEANGLEVPDLPGYVPKLHFRNFLMKDPNGVELEILEREKAD